MSPAAAAAMRAVLQEICFEGVTVSLARGAAVWAALDDILSTSANGTAKEGEGEVYARKAAARRLISNRELVLRDVCRVRDDLARGHAQRGRHIMDLERLVLAKVDRCRLAEQ